MLRQLMICDRGYHMGKVLKPLQLATARYMSGWKLFFERPSYVPFVTQGLPRSLQQSRLLGIAGHWGNNRLACLMVPSLLRN